MPEPFELATEGPVVPGQFTRHTIQGLQPIFRYSPEIAQGKVQMALRYHSQHTLSGGFSGSQFMLQLPYLRCCRAGQTEEQTRPGISLVRNHFRASCLMTTNIQYQI